MTLKDIQPYLEFLRGEVEAQADVAMEIPSTGMRDRRQPLDEDRALSSSLLQHDDDIEDDIAVQGDIGVFWSYVASLGANSIYERQEAGVCSIIVKMGSLHPYRTVPIP